MKRRAPRPPIVSRLLWLLLLVPCVARAEPDGCFPWVQATSSKRPTGAWHKMEIRLPEALAKDPAARARAVQTFKTLGARFLVGEAMYPERLFVRATDPQLDAAAKALAGDYRNTVAQTREWFRYDDAIDLLSGSGSFAVDTGVTKPGSLAPPRGWAQTGVPGVWLVHFAAPLTRDVLDDWLGALAPGVDTAGELPQFVPGSALLLRMSPALAARARRTSQVDWIAPFDAIWKLGASLDPAAPRCPDHVGELERRLTTLDSAPRDQVQLEAELTPGLESKQRSRFLEEVTAAGGAVSPDSTGDHLELAGPRSLLRWLARRPELLRVELAAEATAD